MMTRHSIAFRSRTSDGGALGGAVAMSSVVRVGTITFVTTVMIFCDDNI